MRIGGVCKGYLAVLIMDVWFLLHYLVWIVEGWCSPVSCLTWLFFLYFRDYDLLIALSKLIALLQS